MSLSLIDAVVALDENMVVIKFGKTIKISSLINANFIVQTNQSTPAVVSNPFQAIQTIIDYNQISRTLKLYWNENVMMIDGAEYLLRLVNFLDAANETVPEEQVLFVWRIEHATPSEFTSAREPEVKEVLVQDKSIRTDAYTSIQILAKNPEFYIESVDPPNGDFYLQNDYNQGRVKVVFNSRPALNFLNTKYFKAQRKKIQRTPTRWENVETRLRMHSWKPEVYVDFPSLDDATPSYYAEDKNYFESGYKYRIIVSKDVGI